MASREGAHDDNCASRVIDWTTYTFAGWDCDCSVSAGSPEEGRDA